MGQTRIPARIVNYCDVCHRQDRPLTKCLFCKREYCFMCQGTVVGCMVCPDVCRQCEDDARLRALCDKYAPKFRKLAQERDARIRKQRSRR